MDLKSLKLVVVTVYPAYQQKAKMNKAVSLTVRSACYRNISVNILGSGNKEVSVGLGLKVWFTSPHIMFEMSHVCHNCIPCKLG